MTLLYDADRHAISYFILSVCKYEVCFKECKVKYVVILLLIVRTASLFFQEI
jgi:hypothetical protein